MKRSSLLNLILLVTIIGFAIPSVMARLPMTPRSFDRPMAKHTPDFFNTVNGEQQSISFAELTGPKWQDGQLNPPLSAQQAITLGIEKSNSLLGKMPRVPWTFRRASLYPLDVSKGQWCWMIDFERVGELLHQGPPWTLRLAVMMDGTVVESTGRLVR